jgi:hypothetical protein
LLALFRGHLADALALGAHRIYDQKELRRDFGRVTTFSIRADSYHPSKKLGEQTHYGDQTLALMESIKSRRSASANRADAWFADRPR